MNPTARTEPAKVASGDLSVHGCDADCPGVFDDYPFALCLTHDVDRVSKTFQSPFHAITQRRLTPLRTGWGVDDPYWQFETVMDIERRYDVRSTFYFLHEKHLIRDKPPITWLSPRSWPKYLGYYSFDDTDIIDIIQTLDAEGWEVGLHGSYDSYRQPQRLAYEKDSLETVLGHPITGGRQHYLNLEVPDTWKHHRSLGLKYDASLGSTDTFGFDSSIDDTGLSVAASVHRPFDDEFIVFPLMVMDTTLIENTADLDTAMETLTSLLVDARDRSAIATILWHPRLFNEVEFPGYRRVYEHLLAEASRLGAWIGPVEDAYREIIRGACLSDTTESGRPRPSAPVGYDTPSYRLSDG